MGQINELIVELANKSCNKVFEAAKALRDPALTPDERIKKSDELMKEANRLKDLSIKLAPLATEELMNEFMKIEESGEF